MAIFNSYISLPENYLVYQSSARLRHVLANKTATEPLRNSRSPVAVLKPSVVMLQPERCHWFCKLKARESRELDAAKIIG